MDSKKDLIKTRHDSLRTAQTKADRLFQEIESKGLIRAE